MVVLRKSMSLPLGALWQDVMSVHQLCPRSPTYISHSAVSMRAGEAQCRSLVFGNRQSRVAWRNGLDLGLDVGQLFLQLFVAGIASIVVPAVSPFAMIRAPFGSFPTSLARGDREDWTIPFGVTARACASVQRTLLLCPDRALIHVMAVVLAFSPCACLVELA